MRKITFKDFDKFGREEFAERLTTVIEKFSPFYNEAFVLGLNGKFGSGKTTFLEMWKSNLESKGNQVIYINAWETDFDNEPILPIVSAILSDVSKSTMKDEVKSALKEAIGAAALISNALLDKATGINAQEIAGKIEKNQKSESLEALGEDLYSEYCYKKKAFEDLRKKLPAFVSALEKNPLVIFIDELDRVRPDYAVRFLEAIKHLFSVKGIVFVLAVNRDQLEISIRQLYGEIDFDNYYRRFITREANLPDVYKVECLDSFLVEMSKEFFDEKRAYGLSFPFEASEQPKILKYISFICKIYKFLPREIESYFRIFSQFMLIHSPDKVGKLAAKNWIEAAGSLVAIYIKDRNLYHAIGQQKVTPEEILDHLNSLEFEVRYPLNRDYYIRTVFGAAIFDDKNLNTKIADICLEELKDKPASGDLDKDRSLQINNLLYPLYERSSLRPESFFSYCYRRLEDWLEFIG